MPDPAVEHHTDAASYPAFCRTAEELEVRIELLIGELTVQPTERMPHAR